MEQMEDSISISSDDEYDQYDNDYDDCSYDEKEESEESQEEFLRRRQALMIISDNEEEEDQKPQTMNANVKTVKTETNCTSSPTERRENREHDLGIVKCDDWMDFQYSDVSSEDTIIISDDEDDVKMSLTKSEKNTKINAEANQTLPRTNWQRKQEPRIGESSKSLNEKKKTKNNSVEWNFLEHKGPVFAPPYETLPGDVTFQYNGNTIKLSKNAEEIATFYARMLDHSYTMDDMFNHNFFMDWRKSMTMEEREVITDLDKCNFRNMATYYQKLSEQSKDTIKMENKRLMKEFGVCKIDGRMEKLNNFKIEQPGLFRPKGKHPKMGMVKRRVLANDITINCSKDSVIPKPPAGYNWKEVRHDNTVLWLASWRDDIHKRIKYVKLSPSSRTMGEKDRQKYEKARQLGKVIDKIRSTYRDEWGSEDMLVKQRAIALYFIDKLALRAGNKTYEDQADTVGCCSLRIEHIKLHEELNGMKNVVVFDFLGKDSIRYYNKVEVEKMVFDILKLFCKDKNNGDDLFDRLNTYALNKHLNKQMEGLTAKVFRTYSASMKMQEKLDQYTNPNYNLNLKLFTYKRANYDVAILCNHRKTMPIFYSDTVKDLIEKISVKREAIDDSEADLQHLEDNTNNIYPALESSKLNYLDPRITVAWCKNYNVPIEMIFTKTQREKFKWAIDEEVEDFRF